MKKLFFTNLLFILSLVTSAQIDTELAVLIKTHNLQALQAPMKSRVEVVRLGSRLFREVELSGNRNINCMVCHHPRLGTSDALPFSIGEGGQGIGPGRAQKSGLVIKRNSPSLINLGYKKEVTQMFHDGRVSYDPSSDTYATPEAAFNGKSPLAQSIVKNFTGALAAQSIFPITSPEEMRGFKKNSRSDNELAALTTNLEIWQGVMDRLLKGRKKDLYNELFKKAFPNETKYNIGHVANALAAFMKDNFSLVDTPYDRYLQGNKDAMTLSQKKGLKVFLGRGKCVKCHSGKHLSNFEFKSAGTPQIGVMGTAQLEDEGRFAVTGVKRDLYKFKTPALRNVSLTAPYMHSGVFSTLSEVINHYDKVRVSLDEFEVTDLIQSFYSSELTTDIDPLRNKLRFQLISIGELRKGLKLTEREKTNLLNFIRDALTDVRMQQRSTEEIDSLWGELLEN
ncbi:hypothetical protein A9Q84_11570 [Halobacteriovorax marinus]|uniref:Cytochrome c domain-containing protein n=1 Tax=Halobacteriovorax marinus TaxID=97084 RepID=A0A1Y5F7T5_9BACT|nr:hypothetical protein A9Q84_11570 [Halobacteriovorax marinus]